MFLASDVQTNATSVFSDPQMAKNQLGFILGVHSLEHGELGENRVSGRKSTRLVDTPRACLFVDAPQLFDPGSIRANQNTAFRQAESAIIIIAYRIWRHGRIQTCRLPSSS